jgi:hypothetical protein
VAESQDTEVTADSVAAESSAMDTADEQPKRKRGRRKVLKKTTKRDDKGYLGNHFKKCADISYEE